MRFHLGLIALFLGPTISATLPQVASAGAWELQGGSGQIIQTNAHITANRGFSDLRDADENVTFSKSEMSLFWEHGLGYDLTGVISGSYQDISYLSRDGLDKTKGFGSVHIGTRYNFFHKKNVVVAFQPSYVFAANGENVPDADAGNGNDGVELRGLVGWSNTVRDRAVFADLQIASVVRFDESPDTLKIDATLGVDLVKNKFQTLAQVFFAQTDQSQIGLDRINPNDNLKAQLSIIYHRNQKHSLQIAGFKTLRGRNSLEEKALLIGLYQRY